MKHFQEEKVKIGILKAPRSTSDLDFYRDMKLRAQEEVLAWAIFISLGVLFLITIAWS